MRLNVSVDVSGIVLAIEQLRLALERLGMRGMPMPLCIDGDAYHRRRNARKRRRS